MKKHFLIRSVAVFAAVVSVFAFSCRPASALSKGSRGEEVRRLQQRLKELGFDPGAVDGVYGNATSAAVLLFQSRNGLDMETRGKVR